MPENQESALTELKHELQTLAAFGVAVLLISQLFTRDWVHSGQWLLQSGLLWLYVCFLANRLLPLNRAADVSPLYRNLGWGNRLTILRGGLIALTGGFLFMPPANAVWLPALFYTLAAVLDRIDGFVARRSHQVSLLGNELDIRYDALGLLIAPLLAISWGKLHPTYLLLSGAYYIYQWALQVRRKQELPIHPTPPNPLRRTLAGFQMGFVATALWPLLNPVFTTVAGVAFMLPVLFGFIVDWLVVCGNVSAQAATKLSVVSARYLQPGLRLLLLALLYLAAPQFQALLASQTSLAIVLFGTGCIVLGFAGRFGALLLLVYLGWQDVDGMLTIEVAALIVALSWIVLLGSGRFSLWHWGDDWLARYDGV
jgi:CDP-diacylglycerol--glycerol-3-phosphate 3-phosphatidyltransferase